MGTAALVEQQQQVNHERYEAYGRWERQQMADPRFASVRMLVDDLRGHDEILPETWERFDIEERTWGAEILNAPHSHIDRFRFDGRDIIVKEADGVNPRITLRSIYEKGLEKTKQDVLEDPGLAFQLRRDELFLQFYEQIEAMMRGKVEHDTIHMISTCPRPDEISPDPEEAARLLRKKFYDPERGKSFDYTARRLPNGELELSATTLDNSNLDAHAAVLQAHGYENVSFALLKSHDYGDYLSYDTTTGRPIEVVVAARIAVYDEDMQRQTSKLHRYGREDDTIDAHDFFDAHCENYWVGYKAYHELLARHMAGGELHPKLQRYLLSCLENQERVGHSVVSEDKLNRLRVQLASGNVTKDMAMSCREILVYDHHATLSQLLKQYKETGKVAELQGANLLDAYADAASSNGAAAAANGDTFAGCETATSVSTLTTAAQTAGSGSITLEQVLRMQQEEARHCLNIQRFGFTIRKNIACPFCSKQVDARDTQRTIECLDADCRTVLDKETGKTSQRVSLLDRTPTNPEKEQPRIKLQTNHTYELGAQAYRRELHTVVGGADLVYVTKAGQRITGVDAERIEAAILSQIAAETQAL